MSVIDGRALLAKSLKSVGVDTIFYITGGPITSALPDFEKEGIKLIDVRHEQAAAMMAHAYSRVSGRPGVCMTGAGPDTLNLTTGIANAFMDCSPLVAICGSSSMQSRGIGSFQEVDQFNVMKPIVKQAWEVPGVNRIPGFVQMAFSSTVNGKPGPVYVDFPADVLSQEMDDCEVVLPEVVTDIERPLGDPDRVKKAVEMLRKANRPIVLAGSGLIWSRASAELQEFIEVTGIPFYTTPLARGIVPEDHQLCFPGARSVAWREADVLLVIGTRSNFIVNHLLPPRFAKDANIIQVNIDSEEIGRTRRVDIGIVGDARSVLSQMTQEVTRSGFDASNLSTWADKLRSVNSDRETRAASLQQSAQKPIHPLRLCKEIRDFIPRDTILAVDGHEILNFARQTIPTYCPGHRLNAGPSGCIGVAVPFGVGAKVAKPDNPVIVLTGDGSFGMNGMEIDTAVRYKIPLTIVISNNGSWASSSLPGISRHLGFTRYDKMAEALGAWAMFVEEPDDIRPALEQAFTSNRTAVINVITDPAVQSATQDFAGYQVI
ncbi:thiamine pyrophosphate-binding protein [Chloroflexota bacterium]